MLLLHDFTNSLVYWKFNASLRTYCSICASSHCAGRPTSEVDCAHVERGLFWLYYGDTNSHLKIFMMPSLLKTKGSFSDLMTSLRMSSKQTQYVTILSFLGYIFLVFSFVSIPFLLFTFNKCSILSQKGDALERDFFNLRKMLVVVTLDGTVFGLDSVDGSVLWRLWMGEHFAPLTSSRQVKSVGTSSASLAYSRLSAFSVTS